MSLCHVTMTFSLKIAYIKPLWCSLLWMPMMLNYLKWHNDDDVTKFIMTTESQTKEKDFAQQEWMMLALQQHQGRTFMGPSSWKHQEEISLMASSDFGSLAHGQVEQILPSNQFCCLFYPLLWLSKRLSKLLCSSEMFSSAGPFSS